MKHVALGHVPRHRQHRHPWIKINLDAFVPRDLKGQGQKSGRIALHNKETLFCTARRTDYIRYWEHFVYIDLIYRVTHGLTEYNNLVSAPRAPFRHADRHSLTPTSPMPLTCPPLHILVHQSTISPARGFTA